MRSITSRRMAMLPAQTMPLSQTCTTAPTFQKYRTRAPHWVLRGTNQRFPVTTPTWGSESGATNSFNQVR